MGPHCREERHNEIWSMCECCYTVVLIYVFIVNLRCFLIRAYWPIRRLGILFSYGRVNCRFTQTNSNVNLFRLFVVNLSITHFHICQILSAFLLYFISSHANMSFH